MGIPNKYLGFMPVKFINGNALPQVKNAGSIGMPDTSANPNTQANPTPGDAWMTYGAIPPSKQPGNK